jgi:hypothetical protein
MKRLVVLLACTALAAPTAAQDSNKDMFKKTEQGAGKLFEGMGQEIRKFQGSKAKDAKKDEKKAEKPKDEKK